MGVKDKPTYDEQLFQTEYASVDKSKCAHPQQDWSEFSEAWRNGTPKKCENCGVTYWRIKED